MFETDIVLWLQSFASAALTAVMVIVSRAGEARGLLGAALAIAFGYNFQIGASLFQIVLWNGFLADVLKHLFALPRPEHVDATVQLLGGDEANESPFVAADGDDFFDLPEPAAIEHAREHADGTFGFPSGHVSRATALGMAASLMLRSRVVTWLAVAFVVGTAVSRMYLGRHFLADVLGGLVLGLLTIMVARLILRSRPVQSLRQGGAGARSVAILLTFGSGIPVLFLIFSDFAEIEKTARLAGANLAFALLLLSGVPRCPVRVSARIARAAIALLVYATVTEVASIISARLLVGDGWGFLLAFLPPFVYVLGTARLLDYIDRYGNRGGPHFVPEGRSAGGAVHSLQQPAKEVTSPADHAVGRAFSGRGRRPSATGGTDGNRAGISLRPFNALSLVSTERALDAACRRAKVPGPARWSERFRGLAR